MTDSADRAEGVEAIEVVVGAGDADLVSGLLWGTGVSAVSEETTEAGTVLLRCDVPPGGLDAVRHALGELSAEARLVVVDDGLDSWRAHAEAVRAGRRLVVRPPWVPLGEVAPDTVVIELDPGRAWGHGAHPTSRLCLAEVELLVDTSPGCHVIDVGCGSGVLSVAAAMLGASRVVAVDIDPEACRTTADNAERNGVAERVETHLVAADVGGDPLDGVVGRADLVVANIGAATLVDLAPHLLDHVAPDGTLVVSGLLDPPPPEVATAFAPRRLVRAVYSDGWSVLVFV